jgi:hypothetical protein
VTPAGLKLSGFLINLADTKNGGQACCLAVSQEMRYSTVPPDSVSVVLSEGAEDVSDDGGVTVLSSGTGVSAGG